MKNPFAAWFHGSADRSGDPSPEAIRKRNGLPQSSELNGLGLAVRTTVLLAADDSTMRDVIRRMLEVGGYAVLEAASARSALEVMRRFSGPIALLICDLQTKSAGGRPLTETLELERPGLPLLLITNQTNVRKNGPSRQAILTKPFTMSVLLYCVREMLDDRVRCR